MIDITNYVSANYRYYIYGIGILGRFIYEKIISLYGEESVVGFVETKPTVTRYLKKNVFSADVIGHFEKKIRIIIASASYCQDMKKMLHLQGVQDDQIIIPYKLYDYFKTLYGTERSNIKQVCFWPPINEENQNLIKKIAWFFPDRVDVSIWGEENLKEKFKNNIHIEKIVDKERIFNRSEVIFLWDIGSDEAEYIKYISKVYVVDPEFYSNIEMLNYAKIYYHTFSDIEKKAFENKSKKLFAELRNKFKDTYRARIFCSGPSIDEIYENTYEESINIICNSMVKDKEWLKRIKPDVLAFTDPNYYFSPTEYCEKFFKDVLDGLNLYNYYVFVHDFEVPLLLAHYPEFCGKVIGITNKSPRFAFPSEDAISVRDTKNILTETMIPLASSLCDEIEIAGATGRNPDENFYWKHNGRMQYLELMPTIFEMYPSLFRDQNYANYYEYHCQCVEKLLEYGEHMGKKYRNLTTSYIPALKERTVRNIE